MKNTILALLLLSLSFYGCVASTENVVQVDTTVGYFNYSPVMTKWAADNKKESLTEGEVLGIITGIKRNLEAKGMKVIGVEGDAKRIWFEKPVEGE